MSPEDAVDISLKDLGMSKVVCIPGNHTKIRVKYAIQRVFKIHPNRRLCIG